MKLIKKIIQIGDSEGITFNIKERKELNIKKGDFVQITVTKINKNGKY